MRLFLHPPGPLSAVGRVVSCAAVAVAAALLLVWAAPARADDAEARPAESPYFHVRSDDPATDRLPLKSTHVDVRIAGVIADVTVVQHYRNEGRRPIEARYVFPGSTGSAVHAMNVRLGDRLLTAQVREKQAARIEYEAAKREGRTSALLEQHRPNVFEMNVAHILPGDDVRVELRYTELLTPTDARYGFVFPTVVGPRYVAAATAQPLPAVPYLRAGDAPEAAFDLKLTLDAPVAVREAASPSHEVRSEGVGSPHVRVALAPGGRPAQGRDFRFDYRLAGDRISAGLMLYEGDGENYFLGLVEPPKAVPVRQINPRDYVFVVDISGSMHGHPLETAKGLLQNLIGGLRPTDTFNVLLFSGSNRMLSPASVPATRANIERAMETIREMGGGGSTEIVPALRRLAALPKPDAVSRSIIVVTDGYVSVEAEVFRLVSDHLSTQNVFAFGIGSSVNRHLIEGLARAGRGEAFIVTRPDEAAAQAERLRRIIDTPVLTRVSVRLEGVDAYDVEPAHQPDLMAGRPVVVFGKWKGDPARAALVVEGHLPDGRFRSETPAFGRADPSASALRLLWARERIAALSDQEALEGGAAQKEAILALGLRHGLLTQYTSFIAVDQVVRQAAGEAATVNQPSPMPDGVSDLAVGAEVPSTPEPAAWLALCLVIGVVGATLWSRRRT